MSSTSRCTSRSRRLFLRGAGASLALPFLPRRSLACVEPTRVMPRRVVCVGTPFAMIPQYFFPSEEGLEYEPPRSLVPMLAHQKHMTVFSNLDHGVQGGHWAVHTFLSGVRSREAGAMRDGNISLDQKAVEHVAGATRLPSLNLSVGPGCEMCWTRNGVQVPTTMRPRTAFGAMFADDSPGVRAAQAYRSRQNRSILDCLAEQAKIQGRRLGRQDRKKLDEYFAAIRDVERSINHAERWSRTDKPQPDAPDLQRDGFLDRVRVMYDLIVLALQTDSTRVATLEYSPSINTSELGLSMGFHRMSHFNGDPQRLRELAVVEEHQMREHGRFLTKLAETEDADGKPLLDSTVVLFGSGIGHGDTHSNQNLPILVAGGGLRHKGHVRMPAEPSERVPLCNLYLALLQNFGMEIDQFNQSTSALNVIT